MKKTKMLLGVIISIIFILGLLPVFAVSGVEINETNFPDAVFRAYIKENIEGADDDFLTTDELLAVHTIDVSEKGISDLKGIEHFLNLIRLRAGNNELTSLDVSGNPNLRTLVCAYNNLTSLDLSRNPFLAELYCYNNNLGSLDVSNNLLLETLYCQDSNLGSLDVSNNTELTTLGCYNNNLQSIDVSNNLKLEDLDCENNKLTTLDISNNTALRALVCAGNHLISIDASNSPNLVTRNMRNQTRDITINQNLMTYEMPAGFNSSNAWDLSGGSFDGGTLSVNEGAETVGYKYYSGFGERSYTYNSLWVTLNVTNSHTHETLDDGDCETPIICDCEREMLEASAHSFRYYAEDGVLYKVCQNEGCTVDNATATLISPEGERTYDGATEHNAEVTYSDTWTDGDMTISYKINGEANEDTTLAGSYAASITIDTDKTAAITYQVAKATPILSEEPSASKIQKGKTLSRSEITGGVVLGIDSEPISGTFSWEEPDKAMDSRGTHTETAIFVPDNTNYEQITENVSVKVYAGAGGVTSEVITNYTVKFETSGGEDIKSVTIKPNTKIKDIPEPEKDGFVFEGWYKDKGFTKRFENDDIVTSSMTLYAKWSEEEEETPEEVWENPFTDVKEKDWYFEIVKEATERNLMKGMTDTSFGPDENITRGMFVTILYRADGEVKASPHSFKDVTEDAYYNDAVAWASENDIVNGITDELFAPDKNITREEMVLILYRYAKYKDYDVSVGEDTNILSYNDFDKIEEYAIFPFQWACGDGIITGKGEGMLDPKGNSTRAEASAVIIRLLDKM